MANEDKEKNIDLEAAAENKEEQSENKEAEEISKSLETTEESKREFEQNQQNLRELPKFGRKVFFLNPPLSISSYVMENLKDDQYEVYKITDYKIAKQVLRLSPNAICFIFIDDVMPLRGWYNFIQSFEEDESLKSIFLGAISERIRPKDKENFIMNLKLPGGFISLGGAIVDVFKNIKGILHLNGAKGQRQYVKLNCNGLTNVSGYLADGFRLYQFEITNMSTAGIALKMGLNQGYKFAKNTVIDNICINLNKKTVVCSGLIFDVKIVGPDCYAVILFTKQTTANERKSILNFIYETLTIKFEVLQKNMQPEMFNYIYNESDEIVDPENNKKDEKKDSKSEENKEKKETLDSPEGDVILNEVEEAEEIKDSENGNSENENTEDKSDNKSEDKKEENSDNKSEEKTDSN